MLYIKEAYLLKNIRYLCTSKMWPALQYVCLLYVFLVTASDVAVPAPALKVSWF
jgi:hypothetical protein